MTKSNKSVYEMSNAAQHKALVQAAFVCGIQTLIDPEKAFHPEHGLPLLNTKCYWNPLRDLDQALRLAASMDISIHTRRSSETSGTVQATTSAFDACGMPQRIQMRTDLYSNDEEHARLMCFLVVMLVNDYEGLTYMNVNQKHL